MSFLVKVLVICLFYLVKIKVIVDELEIKGE